MNSIGKVIKFLRISKGISQKEFAKKTNITANYLSLIENNKRIPPKKYLVKASQILGISTIFFTWEDIKLKHFHSKKSKQMAQKINNDLKEIRNIIVHEIISSTG
jgi:transcriptional regulator with XRE-family HTH domain